MADDPRIFLNLTKTSLPTFGCLSFGSDRLPEKAQPTARKKIGTRSGSSGKTRNRAGPGRTNQPKKRPGAKRKECGGKRTGPGGGNQAGAVVRFGQMLARVKIFLSQLRRLLFNNCILFGMSACRRQRRQRRKYFERCASSSLACLHERWSHAQKAQDFLYTLRRQAVGTFLQKKNADFFVSLLHYPQLQPTSSKNLDPCLTVPGVAK